MPMLRFAYLDCKSHNYAAFGRKLLLHTVLKHMRASETIVLRIPIICHVNFCKFLYYTVYPDLLDASIGRVARDETCRVQLCTASCFENSVTNMFA